ncbi:ribosomal protein S18-alanine N-acetyltransferase [Pseudoclostridium thermosuccinogenes]|uniref:ribosomal protein S18-alanine N-acetyltransferase n=1 Tax=Clostridium thermosuccinogenes TaxID=84032 RepID=UPI002FD8FB83
MMEVEIVKMTEELIDDIMIVENLSFGVPWSRNAFLEEIKNNKFAVYIAAKVGGRAVGYAGMWKVLDEAHITNIAVHPEFRNAGIGSLLMETLIDMAKKEGITSMTLEVRKGNINAQRLYFKYGFTVEGIRKGYYSDNGEDALILWKNDL